MPRRESQSRFRGSTKGTAFPSQRGTTTTRVDESSPNPERAPEALSRNILRIRRQAACNKHHVLQQHLLEQVIRSITTIAGEVLVRLLASLIKRHHHPAAKTRSQLSRQSNFRCPSVSNAFATPVVLVDIEWCFSKWWSSTPIDRTEDLFCVCYYLAAGNVCAPVHLQAPSLRVVAISFAARLSSCCSLLSTDTVKILSFG